MIGDMGKKTKRADDPMGTPDPMGGKTGPDRRRNTPTDGPDDAPPAKKRTASKKPPAKPSKPKPKAAAAADPPARPQCTATSRTTGKRCGQRPIPGGFVCRYHGGKAPQVQRSARGRLAELVMPAIETLNHERENAKRSADRQRAANSILDRAGITRGHSAEVDAARALLLERILTLRAESGKPDPLELVATVVDDDEDDDEYEDAEERGDAGA